MNPTIYKNKYIRLNGLHPENALAVLYVKTIDIIYSINRLNDTQHMIISDTDIVGYSQYIHYLMPTRMTKVKRTGHKTSWPGC